LEVTIVTDSGLFSNTERDVWIDVGPKAWKLSGGFDRGSIRVFVLNPNQMDKNSTFDQDSVPLYVNDIKFIRLEKKGIALSDLPPATPELIAIQPIGRKIGGITNAPDSLEDILMPGGPTPANLLGDAKKTLAAADLALNQAQGLIPELQHALDEADKLVSQKLGALNAAEREVDRLQGLANTAIANLSDIENRLNRVPRVLTDRVCHTERVWGTCWKTVLIGPAVPFACLLAKEICNNVDRINSAWEAINRLRPGAAANKDDAVRALNLARNGLDPLKQALKIAQSVRALADLQLKGALKLVDEARAKEKQAQAIYDELEAFVKKLPQLPSLEIARPGQWVPKRVILSVNGNEYIRCEVNERLRRGHPSWTGFWQSISPEDQFINGLRVTNMSESGEFDRLMSGLTTYLKVQDISGWEPGPIKKAKIMAVLKHEPSPGADNYVSLDLQVESINGKELTNRVTHPRFIRVEYRHQKSSNEDDDRYMSWHPGQRLQVEGDIFRDTDRATFYEIHPKKKGDIRPL
jgi:hypothetical protein